VGRLTFFGLLLAVAAGGAVVWFGQSKDQGTEDGSILLFEDEAPPPGTDGGDPQAEEPVASAPSSGGLPRILPPDAAVEDVRDALALKDAAERSAALGSAYGSIGRIAQQERVLTGIRRYANDVEDAQVRGVTWAALGANHSGTVRAWLAGRLRDGPTTPDRIGALLGLAHDAEKPPRAARSLGGLPHRQGALPERLDVRGALPALFIALATDGVAKDALRDALAVLETTLVEARDFYGEQAEAVAALRVRLGR
jgi:hypothetical protein